MLIPCRTHIVEDHTCDNLRAGEGSIVALRDGRLLLLYSRFSGPGDADPAVVVRRVSSDLGETWSEPRVEFSPPVGALNIMSVSLLRLHDGRIAWLYLVKWSQERCSPVFLCSEDEGTTWSQPRAITDNPEYYTINNDRLIQCGDGTLVVPYARWAREGDNLEERGNMPCGIFFSRDGGRVWESSTHEVRHTPEIFQPPRFVDQNLLDEGLHKQLKERRCIVQEPGVVELRDGRILLYMRSVWSIIRCIAAGVGEPWKQAGPLEGFHVCCGPQTIRREPTSGTLVMFYNDRNPIPWPRPEFAFRTPLSVAVSRDDGMTWERRGQLEGDDKNYCYYSLLFYQGQFVASYYESGTYQNKPGRRNLASLKVAHGPSPVLLAPP